MNSRPLYLNTFDYILGDDLVALSDIFPLDPNQVGFESAYRFSSTAQNPYNDLFARLMATAKSQNRSLNRVSQAHLTCTKLESFGLPGHYSYNRGLQQIGVNAPLMSVFGYGCAGLVAITHQHIHAEEDTLWLTIDMVDVTDTRLLRDNAMMSDAAAYCRISSKRGPFKIVATSLKQNGAFHHPNKEWQNWNRSYFMSLVQLTKRLLADNWLTMADIKTVVPHFTNRKTWDAFAKILGLGVDQLLQSPIGKVGHMYGSDPIFALKHLSQTNLLKRNELVLIMSVGLGGTYGAMILAKT